MIPTYPVIAVNIWPAHFYLFIFQNYKSFAIAICKGQKITKSDLLNEPKTDVE
jgi:hypothetical protein